jgi:subtilisin family serine protease
LNIRFYPDVAAADAEALIAALGAELVTALLPHHRYTVLAAPARLLAIAAADQVAFVDEIGPPVELENDGSRALVGAEAAQAPPYDLRGADIDVAVIDGGRVDPAHPDFTGRLTVVDNVATNEHSTHVAGTVGGTGVNSPAHGGAAGQWRGMAPAARLYSYSLSNHLSKYAGIINTYGVEITTNSWGNGVSGSNCSIYGDYRFDAPPLDEIITGLHGRRINITFSGGNERNDCDCGMSCTPPYVNFANVNPPKPAKNLIVVGALNSNNASMTDFSSWGPVDDGRLKPEVVAAGDEQGGDGGVKSTVPGGGYTIMSGTSMAAPAGTGAAALLMERLRAVTGHHPWPSTVRGLLMHSAVDLFNPGPDYRSGYGLIDLIAAVAAIDGRTMREENVAAEDELEFPLEVTADDPLKITMAWDDPAGAEGAAIALVNDLDLELVDPLAVVHRPWVLDPAQPDQPAARGVDQRNNVEQVVVDEPLPGQWIVRVRGTNVPEGPQPVSIWGLVEPGSQGLAAAAPAERGLQLAGDPNPLRTATTLRFTLAAPGTVRLRILDAAGRVVRVVADRSFAAGTHAITWDARNARGERVGPGVYLAEIEAAGRRESQKLVVAPR